VVGEAMGCVPRAVVREGRAAVGKVGVAARVRGLQGLADVSTEEESSVRQRGSWEAMRSVFLRGLERGGGEWDEGSIGRGRNGREVGGR